LVFAGSSVGRPGRALKCADARERTDVRADDRVRRAGTAGLGVAVGEDVELAGCVEGVGVPAGGKHAIVQDLGATPAGVAAGQFPLVCVGVPPPVRVNVFDPGGLAAAAEHDLDPVGLQRARASCGEPQVRQIGSGVVEMSALAERFELTGLDRRR
jgi:hypothetical protein